MEAHDKQVLDALAPLIGAGFALHFLHAREKRPVGDDWSTRPVATIEVMRRRHAPGYNLGLRTGEVSKTAAGYVHVLDIDIRKPEYADEALLALAQLLPEFDVSTFPIVQSGSGGASRHGYFVTDKPFASKKFARSDGFDMVFDPKKQRDVKKRHWELEIFGSGKQVAIPPSIHPDTGLPYTWLRPFNLELLNMGLGPFIPSAAIERVGAIDNTALPEATELKPRLGLTEEQGEDILDDLPLDEWCEDRDGWVTVGMALHHEFGDAGFDMWCEFSRQSDKYDEKTQRNVWKSFRDKPNSVRMATLKAAATSARLRDMFEELPDAFESGPGTPEGGAQPVDIDAMIGGKPPKIGGDQTASDDPFAGFDEDCETPDELHWTSLLQISEEGVVKATLHNIALIVRNDPRLEGLAQINEFTQETVQRTPPGHKQPRRKNAAKPTLQLDGRVWGVSDQLNGDLWSDDRDFAIRAVIEAPETQGGYGIKVSDRDLKAAIVLAANDHAFHPVREYLNGLAWDGAVRVDTLFIRYLGSDDDSYTRSVARMVLVAAVTRIFEPGHKFDFALILEGLQGKRKSTFIEILGRRWFAELDGDFHDPKMMIELMQGAWILELPELTGFQRSDVRAIKAFISRKKDRARLAYARRAGEFPRQCIFIGSTNDREYLKDDTGGRRFWPMPCTVKEIDTDALEREVDQLWAEAVYLYQEMRAAQPHGTLPLYLVEESAKITAARLQESRRIESADDALAGQIAAWLDRPINSGGLDDDPNGQPRYRNETCLLEIWIECMGSDRRSYTQQAAQMIGRAMKLITGWTCDGERGHHATYGRQRMYLREYPIKSHSGNVDMIG